MRIIAYYGLYKLQILDILDYQTNMGLEDLDVTEYIQNLEHVAQTKSPTFISPSNNSRASFPVPKLEHLQPPVPSPHIKDNMADSFREYPPNMAPQDALVVREHAQPDHAVVPYTGEDLSRPTFGPLNPFKDQANALKRKNVLTGSAEETFISEHTFRSKHRALEGKGGPEREFRSGADVKEEAAKIRAGRQKKGDATIADGDGAYIGPWASYKKPEWEEELASDEEVEYVYEDEDGDDVVQSGTVVSAPAAALARRKEIEEMGDETTIFHGSEQFDYQGRT
jgi:pre-mRNA-processing factor 17